MHARTACPGGSPSVTSSAYDIAPITLESRTCAVASRTPTVSPEPHGSARPTARSPPLRPRLGLPGALVGQVGETVTDGLGGDEAQGSLVAGLAEQALARAERDREHGQPQLVDEVVLHQRVHERAAAVHDDLPLCLPLQLRHLADHLPLQHGRVRPFRLFERRGHDVLGEAVQPVHPFAALGWRPRAEVLVAAAAHEEGLGALRLGELELRPRLPVLADELLEPAAVPEPSLAAWVLDDAVERDVLTDYDRSHLASPCLGSVSLRGLRRSRRGKLSGEFRGTPSSLLVMRAKGTLDARLRA